MELLTAYDWPGNVRQLKNEVEKAAVLAKGNMVTSEMVEVGKKVASVALQKELSLPEKMALMEREECLRALEESNWKIINAAKLLGVPRTTLQSKMKKYEISQERT